MSRFGKFESEPYWVEMLWDRANAGFADECVYDGSLQIDGFKLSPEIAELTGYEADENRYVCLWENDQGFVSHMVLTHAELVSCEGFSVDQPTGEYTPVDSYSVDSDFDEMEW